MVQRLYRAPGLGRLAAVVVPWTAASIVDGMSAGNTRPGLVRPREGRMIAGVCAGLARRFGMTATSVRILFVISCVLPGPQFVIYLALWILMPNED